MSAPRPWAQPQPSAPPRLQPPQVGNAPGLRMQALGPPTLQRQTSAPPSVSGRTWQNQQATAPRPPTLRTSGSSLSGSHTGFSGNVGTKPAAAAPGNLARQASAPSAMQNQIARSSHSFTAGAPRPPVALAPASPRMQHTNTPPPAGIASHALASSKSARPPAMTASASHAISRSASSSSVTRSSPPVFRTSLPRPPSLQKPLGPSSAGSAALPAPPQSSAPSTQSALGNQNQLRPTPQNFIAQHSQHGFQHDRNGLQPPQLNPPARPPTTNFMTQGVARPPPTALGPPPSGLGPPQSNVGPPLPPPSTLGAPEALPGTPLPTTKPDKHGGGRYDSTASASSSRNGRSSSNGKNAPPRQLNRPRSTRRPKPSKDTRIDPKQIPRPKLPAKLSGSSNVYTTRTGKGLPPEDCADFVVNDEGNASPRMLRVTTNSLARSRDMMVASQIPVRAHVRPFAPLEVGDSPTPTIDFGDKGPPRCVRCAGFINPYAKFEQDGRAWVCNLCGIVNDITNPEYVCNLDAYGRRYDIDSHPELVQGAVDFIVPSSYTIRPAQDPIFLCIVDVSYSAVSSGLTKHAIESILESLDHCIDTLAFGSQSSTGQNVNPDGTVSSNVPACPPRVGIMTYDNSSLHFYDLTLDHEEPQIHVVPDVDDPFAALPHSSWIMNICDPDEREKLTTLARKIPDMHTSEQQEQSHRMKRSSSYGDDHTSGSSTAAVCAALETLRQTGGRIMCFQSSIPSRGAGKLGNREDGSFYGTDEENKMFHPLAGSVDGASFGLDGLNLFGNGASKLTPSNDQNSSGRGSRSASTSSNRRASGADTPSTRSSMSRTSSSSSIPSSTSWSAPSTGSFYKSLAKECAASQVAVDIFSTSAGFTDIATLSQLCTATGGRFCYHPGFSSSSENDSHSMARDIRYAFTCTRAYEAVMKVRCSHGLVCEGIMGLGIEKSASQREICSVTEDQTWHIRLNYNSDLSDDASDSFLQVSFLYTNMAQQRVVRVLNFAMPIVTSLSAVFRYADVHCVCNSILREAVAESGNFARASSGYYDFALSDIRQKMSDHGVNILYAYRQHCASNHSSGQLILPESLKFLVVFLNGLARSDYLISNDNQNVHVSADVRALRFAELEYMPISLCIPVVYPRLLTILDMHEEAGHLKARKHGAPICVLPKYRYPSGTHISDDEIILLDAGTSVLVWVGVDVPASVLVDLFGVEELPDDAALLRPILIGRRNNDFSNRFMNIVEEHLRRHHVAECFADIRIVKQGSAAEDRFFNLLVEDEGPKGEPSYCAALVSAHGEFRSFIYCIIPSPISNLILLFCLHQYCEQE